MLSVGKMETIANDVKRTSNGTKALLLHQNGKKNGLLNEQNTDSGIIVSYTFYIK